MRKMSETKTAKRLTGGIIAIIILAVCLCITTFALVYASVSVENNLFHTGEVKINLNDGNKTLYSGTANELTKQNVIAADDTLKIGQRRNLTVVFHYPENSGNETQNLDLTFTLCAEATQTKNNPNKLFN